MNRQHRLVGRRRRIERDLLAHLGAQPLALPSTCPGDHENARGQHHLVRVPAGGDRTRGDRGANNLREVVRTMEWMHMKALRDLAGEPSKAGIHTRDQDRDLRMRDRPGVEERR